MEYKIVEIKKNTVSADEFAAMCKKAFFSDVLSFLQNVCILCFFVMLFLHTPLEFLINMLENELTAMDLALVLVFCKILIFVFIMIFFLYTIGDLADCFVNIRICGCPPRLRKLRKIEDCLILAAKNERIPATVYWSMRLRAENIEPTALLTTHEIISNKKIPFYSFWIHDSERNEKEFQEERKKMLEDSTVSESADLHPEEIRIDLTGDKPIVFIPPVKPVSAKERWFRTYRHLEK